MAHICHQTVHNEQLLGTSTPQMHLTAYRCGGCNSMFETICILHEHMQSHTYGGSYHYDHLYLTAFPKYGSVCNATQTDLGFKDLLLGNLTASENEGFKDIPDISIHQSNECTDTSKLQNVINDCSKMITDSGDNKSEIELYLGSGRIKNRNAVSNDTCTEDQILEIGFEISETAEERIIKVEKNDKIVNESFDETDQEITINSGEDYKEDDVSKNQVNKNESGVLKYDPKYKTAKRATLVKSNERKGTSTDRIDHLVDGKQFKRCHFCDKSLSSSADLKRHMTLVHSEEKTEKTISGYHCKYCDFNSKLRKELRKHIKEEHTDIDKKFSCPYCEKEFLTNAAKSHHIGSEHPEIANVLKKFQHSKETDLQMACELCGKLFSTAAGLALHMSSIHLKKRFKCDICNVELSQKFTLKAHKIEKHHENMRGFDCNICKKTFAYKFRLKTHMEQVHTSPEEMKNKYICETCGFFAKSKAGLRYHLTKHNDQRKQFQCEECPYKTFYKCSMTEHTASHQNNRRFVCDVCGDKFFTGKQLKVHMRRHTGEMPFQCEICSKRFRTDIAYARHRDIHLNKMRFKCDYCEKEFVQKTNCLAHMRQHTGEKPFTCDWCGHSFTHNVSRKNHMKKCSQKPIL